MYPKSFKKLIDHFASLPSVGPKMAERLVLYLFKQSGEKLTDFAESMENLRSNLKHCQKCFNISEDDMCYICRGNDRDQTKICVVEDPLDVIALEKTRKYDGLYHVLGGVLDAVKMKSQNEIKFSELEKRISSEKIKEVILATNPTTEGDATALYITRMLKDKDVKITRLARGLATGGDIEHADEITLSSAIINRQ